LSQAAVSAPRPPIIPLIRQGLWPLGWPHLLVLALAIVAPLLISGERADDSWALNQVWATQFSEQLAHNPYPRWLERSFDGFGAPVFYFYPPLAFYLTAAVHYLAFGALTPFQELVAAATLMLFVSGLTMRRWLTEVGGRPWMAVLFMVAPYHLSELYIRGALAEFCAYALVPLVMLGLHRALKGRGFILLSLSYAALVLTHLPTALLISVLLIPPFALWMRGDLGKAAMGIGLGLALAGVYLIPALTLPMNVELMTRHHYGVWDSFVWNWGSKNLMGPIILVVVAMAVLTASKRFWSILAIVLAAVALGLIPVLLAPVLSRVQFAWRALMLVEFCIVTAVALRAKTPSPLVALAYPVLIASLALIPPARIDLSRFQDATEYMPAAALRIPVHTVDLPRQSFLDLPQRSEENGTVTLRRFNFPSWRSCRPIEGVLVRYPVGCEARLVATPSEKLGAVVSLSALAAVAVMVWRTRRRRRPASEA
jgi:hypothetical protein